MTIRKYPLSEHLTGLLVAVIVSLLVNTFSALEASAWSVCSLTSLLLATLCLTWYASIMDKTKGLISKKIETDKLVGFEHAAARKREREKAIAGNTKRFVCLTVGTLLFSSIGFLCVVGSRYITEKAVKQQSDLLTQLAANINASLGRAASLSKDTAEDAVFRRNVSDELLRIENLLKNAKTSDVPAGSK